MFRKSIFVILALLAVGILEPDAGQCVDVYQTGFEADEIPPFTIGPLPQNGWVEVTGSGASGVTGDIVYEGSQSLQIAAGAVVDKSLVSATDTLYVDGWFQPTVGTDLVDLSSAEPAGAIFVFQSDDGLVALDGDGIGGGTWIPTGFTDLAGFVRITLRLDFPNRQWDLYANGSLLVAGLGFKDDSVDRLSGVRISSANQNTGYLDSIRVSTQPPDFLVPTPTPTPSETPTPGLSPTPTPPPAGSPAFFFGFSLHWLENGITDQNRVYNNETPGETDEAINAADLLHFLGAASGR